MPDITVSLSDTQIKALEYVAVSVQDWADNALHERSRLAKNEIIDLLVKHCNSNNIQMATGEDAQISQAYDLKVVQAASAVSDPAAPSGD